MASIETLSIDLSFSGFSILMSLGSGACGKASSGPAFGSVGAGLAAI